MLTLFLNNVEMCLRDHNINGPLLDDCVTKIRYLLNWTLGTLIGLQMTSGVGFLASCILGKALETSTIDAIWVKNDPLGAGEVRIIGPYIPVEAKHREGWMSKKERLKMKLKKLSVGKKKKLAD